ncbi:MAG: purine-nucleoside phosphorylase [Sandaracinaceae bacterium]|nr:purine-nucleoside phosphorylase [Sandaracinaceae bacterium]
MQEELVLARRCAVERPEDILDARILERRVALPAPGVVEAPAARRPVPLVAQHVTVGLAHEEVDVRPVVPGHGDLDGPCLVGTSVLVDATVAVFVDGVAQLVAVCDAQGLDLVENVDPRCLFRVDGERSTQHARGDLDRCHLRARRALLLSPCAAAAAWGRRDADRHHAERQARDADTDAATDTAEGRVRARGRGHGAHSTTGTARIHPANWWLTTSPTSASPSRVTDAIDASPIGTDATPTLAPCIARVRAAARHLEPEIALVLGSGLGGLADGFSEAVAIPYDELPGMPTSTVVGHRGRLVLGHFEGRACVAMQGRVHLYEGHSPSTVALGVRLMRGLGAHTLLVTNAAGGVREDLRPGDLMLITDQLNLTARTPLLGRNDDALGPRFPDMSAAYDPALRDLARRAAQGLAIGLPEGIYAGVLGPQYETPAEVRMLRALGGDAVGMSTVLEVIAARHCGLRVLGLSCITNAAAGLGEEALDHADVERVARRAHASFEALVRAIVSGMEAP